ncbi:MAG TPA: hypothetical protein VFV86_08355 [Nitrososphaeraceae archaeon]|nr:hypothetical protein [Nitrososphaeraceae archaeon]
MRTPSTRDFFTPKSINREGGQIDASGSKENNKNCNGITDYKHYNSVTM